MTIETNDQGPPSRDLAKGRPSGERHANGSQSSPEPIDERSVSNTALGRTLLSWGTAARFTMITAVLLGVLLVGAWLFGLNVEVGPIHFDGSR